MIFLALSLIITVPFSFIIPFVDISLYKVVVGYITLMVMFGMIKLNGTVIISERARNIIQPLYL